MSNSNILPELPFLCITQIIFELSDSSSDLYSCLFVNRMWCRCAIALLWQRPFYWSGDKAGRMVAKFLQLFPQGYLDDLEYVMGLHIPSHNSNPMFNYLHFVRS